jgi:hypothetical protein
MLDMLWKLKANKHLCIGRDDSLLALYLQKMGMETYILLENEEDVVHMNLLNRQNKAHVRVIENLGDIDEVDSVSTVNAKSYDKETLHGLKYKISLLGFDNPKRADKFAKSWRQVKKGKGDIYIHDFNGKTILTYSK